MIGVYIVWKTMLIVYFPSNFDVDNSVDKLKSYTQVKIEIVDC